MGEAANARDRVRRSDPNIIRSLDRGLRILNDIVAAPAPVRLHELADRFNIDKASAYRFLATLERYDLVEKDAQRKTYTVGGRLVSWLATVRPELAMVSQARQHLQWLVSETGESGHLGVLSRGQVLFADYVPSDNILTVRHNIGTYQPLHCAAVGKAILAFLPEEARGPILAELELERRTERTVVDKAALVEQLDGVRRTGWAFDDGETYEDVCCVGAPVLDGDGYPVCSVGVSLARTVVEREPRRRDQIASAVRTCARALERDIVG